MREEITNFESLIIVVLVSTYNSLSMFYYSRYRDNLLILILSLIPHHEGAIVMAKDAISKSTRPKIKQLNQDILTSQQAEIKQMKQWRKAWYNK